jgi:uncharacterized protein (TIGR01777 family)
MSARGIVFTGATGFIGPHVVRALRARGDTVWVWARDVAKARRLFDRSVNVVGALADIPTHEPVHGIVNLAGAPVVGPPWTRARRQLLIDSRVKPTQAVIEWAATRATLPRVMVSASAIGFYGSGGEDWLVESSPPQDVFQSKLCVAREFASTAAEARGIRAVNLRFGLVFGRDGGIYPRFALAARLGGAAVLGDGTQWMSWIHIDDLVSVIELALDDETLRGAVNAVSPEPVRQRDFQRVLTRSLHRPLWLRVPARLLSFGLGEMADLLIRSQRVAPRRLQDCAFEFRHPRLEDALRDLQRDEGAST